ncbi:MAG: U32 family peptidase [Cyanobacteria bacterium P01_A01_bin.45]
MNSNLPELLSPAGNWECAKAAVENGADAIYFGLDKFNARMRAENFSTGDLPELMKFLHLRGVKGYVTLNTLIFPDELRKAQKYLRSIIAAGVDAVIVQDVGICRLIRHISSDFPIHGSTQMTVTSAAGVEFAKELGCELVVLARECSVKEINKIRQQSQEELGERSLPLEVFIHGALCVAYSGQCLTSEALGGRSANRGECAQACRMPYDLIVDGQEVDLGERKYLLSPQDLAGLDVIRELISSGVSCLKIEGRLKSPEYVANVTRVYRQALDRQKVGEEGIVVPSGEVFTSKHSTNSGRGESEGSRYRTKTVTEGEALNLSKSKIKSENKEDKYNLEMAFSRGLYTGWFEGIDNQKLVHARFGKKRGVYLGKVKSIEPNQVSIRLQAPVKAGDGIVFDNSHPEAKEEGGRVYKVFQKGKDSILTFGKGNSNSKSNNKSNNKSNINWRRVYIGDRVWKTSDPELDKQLRQTYSGETPQFQRPISIEVYGEIADNLIAIACDELGNIVKVESRIVLHSARNKPLSTERLQEQFSRLGNTPFYLGSLENHIEGSVILPVKELNWMRREIVTQLETLRIQSKLWEINQNASLSDLLPSDSSSNLLSSTSSPNLIVLVRNLKQLRAVLNTGVETIYCEFEDPRKYREAVDMVRDSSINGSQTPEIWVAPPRIAKPSENWILQQVISSKADGYLIRNYDQLKFFSQERCIGDFSLNIANPLSADYYMQKFHLERLTPSYDLNIHQLKDLLKSTPPQWFEVTIHQHMPMFHMEHCVFCAFLSEGNDFRNCGRPCEKHQVEIRDRVGTKHILQADTGCRNTVFNGTAQTGAEYVKPLKELNLKNFRIEFVNENPQQVKETIFSYQQLLKGEITGSQLWRELKLQNQLGVTRGSVGS